MKRNNDMGFWMINASAGERQEGRLGKCMWSDRGLPSPSFISFNFVLKCKIFIEKYIFTNG